MLLERRTTNEPSPRVHKNTGDNMKHLKDNNEIYITHFKFAWGIGLSLAMRGFMFLLHGFIPAIGIPKSLNLEATSEKIVEWNNQAESRIQK